MAQPLRVLVTGGRGRIGARTVERLAESGHVPIVSDLARSLYGAAGLSPFPYLRADLTDLGETVGLMAKARPDVVVHTAGIPEPNHDTQSAIFSTNVLSTYNVCEAMATLGVARLVYLSSETVPGFVTSEPETLPEYVPVDEQHPIRPQEAYALSKYFGELMGDALVRRTGADVVSVRASFVVGRDEYRGLLTQLRDAPPGPFGNLWSYVDIDDLADLVVLAVAGATTGHHVVYAAQSDNFMDRPLEELLGAVYGERAPVVRPLSRSDASGIDSSKARGLFGWQPTRSWRDS